MKIKSKVNGLVIGATQATTDVVKLGEGSLQISLGQKTQKNNMRS